MHLRRRKTMSEPDSGGRARGAIAFLSLAAAPTFAIMALLSGLDGAGPEMLCMPAQHASPLSGMATMYGLMSAFHAGAWLKLISGRRGRPAGSPFAGRVRTRPPLARTGPAGGRPRAGTPC
jgi:hypothetical protein